MLSNILKDDKVVENKSVLDNQFENKVVENKSVLDNQFEEMYLNLHKFKQSITAMQNCMKTLERNVKKEIKLTTRENKRKKNNNRKPSGFARPTHVSEELCLFMGRTVGTEIARTEVTQYVINYIKSNQLQFVDNKKIIMPDNALKSLLGVNNEIQVTYFNLQGLMNKHFVTNK
jgi:chromatin remodeling complex protein RSC6